MSVTDVDSVVFYLYSQVQASTASANRKVHWSATTQAAEVPVKSAVAPNVCRFCDCDMQPRQHATLLTFEHDLLGEPHQHALRFLKQRLSLGLEATWVY